jgi:hypothetical protein
MPNSSTKGKGAKARRQKITKQDIEQRARALTAARIRAVLESKRASRKVKERLYELAHYLHEWCGGSMFEDEPALAMLMFEWGAAGLAVMRHDRPQSYEKHRHAFDEIARLAAEHEPEEYRVARRCVEIYNEWSKRKPGRKYADGAYFFILRVDAVMEHGEGALLDPSSAYFVPFFVKAAREVGPRHHSYRQLLDLIKRVDEGADLNALYDEEKKAHQKGDK